MRGKVKSNNAIRRDHTTLTFNIQQLVGWASHLISELYTLTFSDKFKGNDMRILMTLKEVNESCNSWTEFCEQKGFELYCMDLASEDFEVELTMKEAIDFGIIKEVD